MAPPTPAAPARRHSESTDRGANPMRIKMAMIWSAVAALLILRAVNAGAQAADAPPATGERLPGLPASQGQPELDGAAIIGLAHEAAGGETFVRPGTLFLSGRNIIYDEGGGSRIWDRYAMWRMFADEKADAHAANGKVRIEAWRDGELEMLLSFDGEATYDRSGRMADQSANAMWSNSFGFGAIRNALDAGWTQDRRADRAIDGKPAYLVELTDPSGGSTLFGIDQATFDILYVGFNTPRGWHERRYSDFFSKPGTDWHQAGRVRLFYNGVKSNEAIWSDFEIGKPFGNEIFTVGEIPGEPAF